MMESGVLRIAHLGSGIFAREAHAPVFIELQKAGLVQTDVCWSRSIESARGLADVYEKGLGTGRLASQFFAEIRGERRICLHTSDSSSCSKCDQRQRYWQERMGYRQS
mmetsp:Transcript_196/g.441  ORF Transcript_196/g.441 Transcript_196/m.441 type:complete len:108 (+) Transcript_196:182-505(+)